MYEKLFYLLSHYGVGLVAAEDEDLTVTDDLICHFPFVICDLVDALALWCSGIVCGVSGIFCCGHNCRRPAGESIGIFLIVRTCRRRACILRHFALCDTCCLQVRAIPVNKGDSKG